jgi:glycosyltransferase involved in cell wall biosynthesis
MTSFSIFLPVRNGWPYVVECVESILGQTYPHFELNVLDNQSTDGTLQWLNSLDDSRVRIWTSSVPLTIEDSWARIMGVEKKEFMTLIGHDDILNPSFLAATKTLIDRHPDASLYCTGSRMINSEGKTIRRCRPAPDHETAAQYLTARFTFQRDIFGTGYVMRSAEYNRIGGIPGFERLYFADDALWLSLLSGSYMASDPAEHFAVRIHPKSESASLPSAWPTILRGLSQFTAFLHRYIETDDAVRAVTKSLEPGFLLAYHRNAYIYALVEASQLGKIIDPAVLRFISASLATSTPSVADKLRRSPKVAMLESLNASPLRWLIPHLWRAYNKIKNKV